MAGLAGFDVVPGRQMFPVWQKAAAFRPRRQTNSSNGESVGMCRPNMCEWLWAEGLVRHCVNVRL